MEISGIYKKYDIVVFAQILIFYAGIMSWKLIFLFYLLIRKVIITLYLDFFPFRDVQYDMLDSAVTHCQDTVQYVRAADSNQELGIWTVGVYNP